MVRQPIISVLDIGSSSIHCLVGEVQDGKIEIIGHSKGRSKGVKRGVVVDLAEAVKSIESAVNGTEKVAGFAISHVYVGTTGDHLTSADARGAVAVSRPDREVTEADVTRALEAARFTGVSKGLELLHLIPRSFVLDHQQGIRNPVGLTGSRLEADTHLVLGKTSLVANLRKAVEKAGLEFEAQGLVLEPLAASLGVMNMEERDLGTALVDLGGGVTDVAVFRNKELFATDFVPWGGDSITNDIAVTLKVPLSEAERLKIEEGKADPALAVEGRAYSAMSLTRDGQIQVSDTMLARIIEARLVEILAGVRASLDRQARGQKQLAGVVLTGGGARLPGVLPVVENALGLPARIGVPLGFTGPEEVAGNAEWAAAAGLLVYGSGKRDIRLPTQRGSRMKEWLNRVWARIQDFL